MSEEETNFGEKVNRDFNAIVGDIRREDEIKKPQEGGSLDQARSVVADKEGENKSGITRKKANEELMKILEKQWFEDQKILTTQKELDDLKKDGRISLKLAFDAGTPIFIGMKKEAPEMYLNSKLAKGLTESFFKNINQSVFASKEQLSSAIFMYTTLLTNKINEIDYLEENASQKRWEISEEINQTHLENLKKYLGVGLTKILDLFVKLFSLIKTGKEEFQGKGVKQLVSDLNLNLPMVGSKSKDIATKSGFITKYVDEVQGSNIFTTADLDGIIAHGIELIEKDSSKYLSLEDLDKNEISIMAERIIKDSNQEKIPEK